MTLRTGLVALTCCLLSLTALHAEIIVAEGESFTPLDNKGWKVTHQQDSYGSHTYGGMWLTHGGCLGAPAQSEGSVAKKVVQVEKAGAYRVWSKYQAPPYYNYQHRIEIIQNGKTIFSHVYGKKGTDRLWSFSGVSDELWWPWGVDHDTAEAPKNLVQLQAGPAELRLITVANQQPAGDRFVDFIVLTTNPKDEYRGFKPYQVGSPFAFEALEATRLYLRFKNAAAKPAQLSVSRQGHFQPNYGGATIKVPEQAAAPGQWSEWINIGPFCRLVHDEGLFLGLPGADMFQVQFARDQQGKDVVGDLTLGNGGIATVPIDITWRKGAVVKSAEQHAREIMADSVKWRRANGGKRPQRIAFYGAFSGKEDWVSELKAALGYNTMLPEKFGPLKRDGLHAHAHNPQEIEAFAKRAANPERLRVLSFGDEIGLGSINYKDPKLQEKFRGWLKARGVTAQELGMDPAQATLTPVGNPRLVWYTQIFNEEERFGAYRDMTALTKKLLGPEVLTGANYSPHHGCLYYGHIYQWIDIFKHRGMSMFWAEDYLFSVPEPPQMVSFQFAQMRCAVKYHNQPIHFYVMPHAPGQEPGFLRRNMLLSIGFGAAHIDNFWIAPPDRFTENYVSWGYRDTFRTLCETIHETAEVEDMQTTGKVRPARVALVLSKATDFHESRLKLDKSADPFARECKNAPAKLEQWLGRKDQQLLYLALRQAQHAVDGITEEDITEGALNNYDVVYFAGEWSDSRAVNKLAEWVQQGGILYASCGLGLRNQFNEPEPAMLKLLGLKDAKLSKNLVVVRTQLELPLAPTSGTITLDGTKIAATGVKQQLTPSGAKVLGTWEDGSAAVTVHDHGKGKVFAVGTAAGLTWMKTGLKQIPWARGGRHTVYNPEGFSPATTKLVGLGVSAKAIAEAAACSIPGVEAIVLDSKQGSLVTLVNWTNAPLKDVEVRVRLAQAPRTVRSISQQQALQSTFKDGVVTFRVNLPEADYIVLGR